MSFSLKEKYRALIRVKTVQYRKQKAVRKRQRAHRDYDLGKTSHSQEKDWFKLTEMQADVFSAFWKGIWEIEGECNLRHPMVEECRKEMREQTSQASSDQSITCLNTSYKLLTGTLAVILTQHVHRKCVLLAEQKAGKTGHRGCLNALLIDAAIAGETRLFNRNLLLWP